jgi:hypothetical protein
VKQKTPPDPPTLSHNPMGWRQALTGTLLFNEILVANLGGLSFRALCRGTHVGSPLKKTFPKEVFMRPKKKRGQTQMVGLALFKTKKKTKRFLFAAKTKMCNVARLIQKKKEEGTCRESRRPHITKYMDPTCFFLINHYTKKTKRKRKSQNVAKQWNEHTWYAHTRYASTHTRVADKKMIIKYDFISKIHFWRVQRNALAWCVRTS